MESSSVIPIISSTNDCNPDIRSLSSKIAASTARWLLSNSSDFFRQTSRHTAVIGRPEVVTTRNVSLELHVRSSRGLSAVPG